MDDGYSVTGAEGVDTDSFFEATIPLMDSDFALIGRFVQSYSWADLHSRRIIGLLRQINRGETCDFAIRINDNQALKHLRTEADLFLGPAEVKEGILKAADILDLHRDRRHELAHWAVRRSSTVSAFVIMTKSGKETKRRDIDISGSGDIVGFGILPLDELSQECQKLLSHGEYLSKVVAFLHDYRDQVIARVKQADPDDKA